MCGKMIPIKFLWIKLNEMDFDSEKVNGELLSLYGFQAVGWSVNEFFWIDFFFWLDLFWKAWFVWWICVKKSWF